MRYFLHIKKNDQKGEKKYPRNNFPNPLEPIICPLLLAITLYLCLFPDILIQNGAFFPGHNQYIRFSHLLSRVIDAIDGNRDEIINLGGELEFLGVHSIRKGAATYASSGSTCGPSGAAVNLWVGWTLGNVQDSYIKYEAGGDQYCGRVLSGLPVHSYKFAIIGPLFVFGKTFPYLKVIVLRKKFMMGYYHVFLRVQ